MKLLPSFFKLTSVFISQIKKRPSDQLTPVSEQEGKELFFLINMITATVGSLIFIFIFKNLAFRYGRSAYLIAFNSIFFGILMIIADRWGKNSLENTDMMEKDVQPKLALLIGFFQSIAIFPGVSRSGATLSISRMMGLSREEAAHFSFLLSLPIIFAGCIAKGIDFVTQMLFYPQMVVAKNLLVLVLGIVISFVVGYFTIHYFLKLIKKIGLIYFSYYRFALGIIILIYFSYH